MATRGAIARMRAAAEQRIMTATQAIGDALGVPCPDSVAVAARKGDPDFRAAKFLEAQADYLESVAQAATAVRAEPANPVPSDDDDDPGEGEGNAEPTDEAGAQSPLQGAVASREGVNAGTGGEPRSDVDAAVVGDPDARPGHPEPKARTPKRGARS